MSQTSIELAPSIALTILDRPEAAHLSAESHGIAAAVDGDGRDIQRNVSAATTITSKGRTAVIIASITMVTGIASMLNGLVTVILPTLQQDLALSDSILLWQAHPHDEIS